MDDAKTIVRKTFSPGFMLAFGILLAGMVGLRGLTGAWEWALSKKTLPMRRSFENMPKRVGPYEHIESQKLSEVMERSLSTDNYISAVYRNHDVEAGDPGSGFSMHSAYYTGNDEPVSAAHVPEVCYVGGGYERKGLKVTDIALDIPGAEIKGENLVHIPTSDGQTVTVPGLTVPVRQFDFLTPGRKDSGSVFYFFIYNGDYVSSRNKIGLQFLDRSSQYVYYAKIEVMPGRLVEIEDRDKPVFAGGVEDPEKAKKMTADFLAAMLPELVACLPDWEAVEAGDIPETHVGTGADSTAAASPTKRAPTIREQ